jgi:hypothetical protein
MRCSSKYYCSRHSFCIRACNIRWTALALHPDLQPRAVGPMRIQSSQHHRVAEFKPRLVKVKPDQDVAGQASCAFMGN